MSWAEWAVFLIASTAAEALFWSRHRGRNPGGIRLDNIHLWLFTARLGPWTGLYLDQGLQAGIFAALSFSFFHDGIYYQARKWIDGAYRGFFDTSTTSTAFYTMGPIWRTGTAVLGALIWIF